MARAAAEKKDGEKKEKAPAVKKAKAPSGGPKKSSPYNQFMKRALAKLKEEEPDLPHKERFKKAAQSWAESPENPKNKE